MLRYRYLHPCTSISLVWEVRLDDDHVMYLTWEKRGATKALALAIAREEMPDVDPLRVTIEAVSLVPS